MPRFFSGGCTHFSQHPPHRPQAGHTRPQKSDQCQQRDAQQGPSLLKPLCLLQRGWNTLRSGLNWSQTRGGRRCQHPGPVPLPPCPALLASTPVPSAPTGPRTGHSCERRKTTPTTNRLKHLSPLFWSLGEISPLIFTATFFLHKDTSAAMSPAQSLLSAHSTHFRKPHRVCGTWSPQ